MRWWQTFETSHLWEKEKREKSGGKKEKREVLA